MLVKFSKWFLVAALCLSIGGHWAVLQSAAWCGMIVNYSQGSTLKDGLEKTFDGKHPCKLCKFVAEGKKSEKKSDSQLKITKPDLFAANECKPFLVAPTFVLYPSVDSVSSSRFESPLTPPPRRA